MSIKQKIVGVYYIGYEQVELVLREDYGGEFYATPEVGKIARIKIGADYENFSEVVEVLLHEALEFVMFREGCRLEPSNNRTNDQGKYIFHMTHAEFADVSAKTAECLTDALPDLGKAWKKWKNKRNG